MNRINLSVDIVSNELLLKTVNEAIEATVRGRAREVFEETMREETDRLIKARVKEWTEAKSSYYGQANGLQRMVNESIDAAVKGALGQINVTRTDIEARIGKQVDAVGADIETYVYNKIDQLSAWSGLDAAISTQVATKVNEQVTAQVQKLPTTIIEILAEKLKG